MKSNRRLILLGVAVLTAAIVLTWHFVWVAPKKDCLREGGVWDEHSRSCVNTVTITP